MSNIIPIHYCSFCGKSDREVETLIIANKGSLTGVCNLCVDTCNEIIAERKASPQSKDDQL